MVKCASLAEKARNNISPRVHSSAPTFKEDDASHSCSHPNESQNDNGGNLKTEEGGRVMRRNETKEGVE